MQLADQAVQGKESSRCGNKVFLFEVLRWLFTCCLINSALPAFYLDGYISLPALNFHYSPAGFRKVHIYI